MIKTDASLPTKCLNCGIRFENSGEIFKNWFECSECGAIHIQIHEEWFLEDDIIDLEG